jgi:hypothetical protein
MQHPLRSLFLAASVSALPCSAYAAFSDMPSSHLHFDAVTYVQQQKIVTGYADGTFRPEQSINRAEFTKIIMEAASKEKGGSSCFGDVKEEWFAASVCGAKTLGIIGGYPDGSFQPGKNVSFAEAAKIIVSAFEASPPAQGSPWFAPFIAVLTGKNAVPADVLAPTQPLTRAQMAEIIFKLRTGVTGSSSSVPSSKHSSSSASSAMKQGFSVGVHISVSNSRYYITGLDVRSPAQRSGLRGSDEIMEIDGQILKGKQPPEIEAWLDGKEGTTSELKIARLNGGIKTLTLVRQRSPYVENQWSDIGGFAAFLTLSFDDSASAAIVQVPAGAKGILFDFRGNFDTDPLAKLDMIDKTLSLFLPKGTAFAYKAGNKGSNFYKTTGEPVIAASVPVVIIMNYHTSGTADFIANALQAAKRATVIGSSTQGLYSIGYPYGNAQEYGLLSLVRNGEKSAMGGVTVDASAVPGSDPTVDTQIAKAVDILSH